MAVDGNSQILDTAEIVMKAKVRLLPFCSYSPSKMGTRETEQTAMALLVSLGPCISIYIYTFLRAMWYEFASAYFIIMH